MINQEKINRAIAGVRELKEVVGKSVSLVADKNAEIGELQAKVFFLEQNNDELVEFLEYSLVRGFLMSKAHELIEKNCSNKASSV